MCRAVGMIFGGYVNRDERRGGGGGIAGLLTDLPALSRHADSVYCVIRFARIRRPTKPSRTGTGNPYERLASALSPKSMPIPGDCLCSQSTTAHLFIIAPFLGA